MRSEFVIHDDPLASRRDVDRWWRRNSQRDRDEFDRIDGIDVDIDWFDINDGIKPDERIDDDGIDIKSCAVY